METSKYLKGKQNQSVDWMKKIVYVLLFVAVFFNLINRAASPMLYLFIGASAIYLLMRRNVRVSAVVLCFFAFCLYSMFACFWTPANDPFEAVVRTILKYAAFAFCLYNIVETKDDCDRVLNLICVSGLAFCLFSVGYYGLSVIFSSIQTGERLGQEICGINTFGMYASLTFALCLYLARIKGKWLHYVLMLLPLILIVASSSRKALLLGFCAILYFFAAQKLQKSFAKGILIIGVIAGGVLLILQLPAFEQIWMRLQIFFETTVQGSTSSDESTEIRFRLIDVGLQFFKDHPIFGYGTNSFRYIAGTYFSMSEISAHNNYVDILVNFGLIGFSVYYYPSLFLLWNAFKGILREIPVFYFGMFFVLVSFVLLDMSYVSYHFIIPYVFFTLFARVIELYQAELKEKVVHEEVDAEVEHSKYLK